MPFILFLITVRLFSFFLNENTERDFLSVQEKTKLEIIEGCKDFDYLQIWFVTNATKIGF